MTRQTVQPPRLIPRPSDVVFAITLLVVVVGGRRSLFHDPGTYWHLRLGRDILATGTVPRCDAFTFTRFQQPWIDQSWGFDALLAVVFDRAGWSGAAALAALGLAWVYASLTRDLIAEGARAEIAMVVALLTEAIGQVHFLIRPHLFTLAFVYLTFRLCRDQQRRGGWSIAWVVVLTGVLANIHGGFVALPLIVACAGVGRAISQDRPETRSRELPRYAVVFTGCCLGSLLNPYGLELHRHVVRLLFTSGVTSLIDEYRPAPFGESRVVILELAVLGLVALPAFSKRRIDRADLVHVLVWLHLALTSIRNAPLFALAAAPVIARQLDGLAAPLWNGWNESPGRGRWRWAAVGGLACLAALKVPLGSPDPSHWPLDAVAVVDAERDHQRLFHELNWGGLIALECRNGRRSFIDDRFELFGAEAVLEYLRALEGGPEWDAIRDRERIDAVWVQPDRGLARRLRNDPSWTIAHSTPTSIMFLSRERPSSPRAEPPSPLAFGPTAVRREP